MPMPESLSGADLLDAYERTTGEANDPTAAAQLAEIERRELDL